jgi:ATP/maltotriose-dependent transcriptional regulator MalT
LTVVLAAPGLIDRGDLVAALDRAAARKVTVISAPADSGKTSLLRAWAGRPGAAAPARRAAAGKLMELRNAGD